MKKADLVAAVAAKAGITKKDADAAIAAVAAVVVDALKAGDEVALAGVGTFKVKAYDAKPGVNPATGEKITIAAHKAPKFVAAKALKDAVK